MSAERDELACVVEIPNWLTATWRCAPGHLMI